MMPDSPVLDGGARFPEVLTIRLPEGFLSRMKAAAEREGISHRDFARRAIAERLARTTEPGGSPEPTTAETAGTSHG
ncbi:ribbon-helix-helix domain-containing protein [Methylobacterium ajmalii]|uniref:Ribbon-helix-helix domain-containing protein n=1 Tax=Methylobacterium ajmalii TaxID=2738439 RepID=A0ABV0A7N1_9HYPH